MQQTSRHNRLTIVCMLDRLNRAKRQYNTPSSEEQRQEADRTFADCFDWLVEHDIPFQYDAHTGLWLYAGSVVIYS